MRRIGDAEIRRIVALGIDRNALLIPAHLPTPHALRVSRMDGLVLFVAAHQH